MTRSIHLRPRVSRRLRRAFLRARRATDGVAAVEFALLLPFMLLLYLGSAETTQAVMTSRKAAVAAKTLSDLTSQESTSTPMTDAIMGNIFNAAAAIMQPFSSGASALSMNVTGVSFTTYTSNPTTATAPSPYAAVWIPNTSVVASSGNLPTSTNPGYAAKVRWSVSPSSISSGSGISLTNAAALTRSCGTGTSASLTPAASSVAPAGTNLQSGLYGPGSVIVADISYLYTPTFGASIVSWTNSFSWNASSGMTSHSTTYMQPRNSWSTCSEATGNTSASDTWVCYPARETTACLGY